MGRLHDWQPDKWDNTFENVAVGRLIKAARIMERQARAICPDGTGQMGRYERNIYKSGDYAGRPWTGRDAGRLKRSIKVKYKKSKRTGKPLKSKRKVRIGYGDWWAFYASAFEHQYNPVMQKAFNASWPRMKDVIGI